MYKKYLLFVVFLCSVFVCAKPDRGIQARKIERRIRIQSEQQKNKQSLKQAKACQERIQNLRAQRGVEFEDEQFLRDVEEFALWLRPQLALRNLAVARQENNDESSCCTYLPLIFACSVSLTLAVVLPVLDLDNRYVPRGV